VTYHRIDRWNDGAETVETRDTMAAAIEASGWYNSGVLSTVEQLVRDSSCESRLPTPDAYWEVRP